MKKRLLSAALALAMMLTLLPVSAFAYKTPAGSGAPDATTYTDSKGDTYAFAGWNANHTSYTTVTVARATSTNNADGREYGKWYWLANKGQYTGDNQQYFEVTSGIVAGANGSGQWYPDVTAYINSASNGTETVKGAFTVLGSGVTADLSQYKNTSLTVDIESEGFTLIVPDNTLTQLTLTSTYLAESGNSGGVANITTSRSSASSSTKNGLTINATNITFGSVTLSGRANTLNLTNCTVNGSITMDGETFTSATSKTYSAQKVTAKVDSKLANAKSVINGSITISNADSSAVSLTDTTGGQAISVMGNGGSVTVAGLSNVGAISTAPRTTSGQWPSVTVTGGTTGAITQDACAAGSNSNSITIKADSTTGITNIASITADKGAVTITSADVTGKVEVKAGSLTVSGSGVDVGGDVTLGENNTTTLSITATGSTFNGIKAAANKGANVVINQWVGKRWNDGGNDYGVLDLGSYTGKKVTGGTFSQSTTFSDKKCLNWLDAYTTTGTSANLQFYVKRNGKFDLYSKNELARAISDIGTTNASKDGNIIVLGQTDASDIVLMNGNVTWAKIGFNVTTGLVLPTQINNVSIVEWIGPNQAIVKAGKEEPIAFTGSDIKLNATGIEANVKRFTKATVSLNSSEGEEVQNQNVNVTLNGNNIALSGAVNPGAGGWATIKIDLETDVVDTDGNAVVLKDVLVEYNPSTRSVLFSTWQPTALDAYGVIVQDGALVLNKGTGARYTVSANLSVSASDLGIVVSNKEIQATVGGSLSRWTDAQKKDLIDKITAGEFDINGNQAVLVAINAAQATITNNSSVASWVTNAKNNVWRNGLKDANGQYITVNGRQLVPHTGNFDPTTADGAAIADGFGKAYLVPYLVVNITEYNPNGTMTATLTPYYRVDVSDITGYDQNAAYTAQAGRALALTSDSSDQTKAVKVKFALPAAFNTQFMHQDGKYVYQATGQEWSIVHTGANGTLGSIVINGTDGPIKMLSSIALRVPTVPTFKYDSLQAAIDDTVPGKTVLNEEGIGSDYEIKGDTNAGYVLGTGETLDTILIGGSYTGSCDITMTGLARKVAVKAEGQQNVKSTSANVDVQTTGGFLYLVELKQGTVVNPTANITVASVTGGTARVNVNPATVGSTVTITLTPATGYVSNGVSVRTDAANGVASTNVLVSGSGNTYTFTMPSGSVTVTPSFRLASQTQTETTVTVSSPSTGSAITSAIDNKAAPGSVVTVTTYPRAGQRTMGVSISTNGSGTTATRTGVNTFRFTVPANATSVVVTPTFDTDNNTVFSDVWSSEYYSNPVAWAVSNGVTDGTSTYTFSPNNYCTRAQMVTFLWRAAGKPPVANVRNPFTDVSPTLTPGDYYNAILWAVSEGITDGKTATRFAPNDIVTRGQAVTFLYRFENQPAAGTTSQFSDVPSSEYYAKPVSWAANRAVPITTGKTTTTFDPNAAVTRAQAVTFLYRDRTNKLA